MLKKMGFLMTLIGCNVYSMAADQTTSWSYHGNSAPEYWGILAPEYATCNGYNQTPINITGSIDAQLPNLNIDYPSHAHTIINNGHTIQIAYTDGSSIEVDGERFALKQMHFHTPSENHIEGQSFPMELHLVHANAAGALAVIGVMFEYGQAHPQLKQLWQNMPKTKNQPKVIHTPNPIIATEFLPKKQDYYRFSGSLTTPPCSEGVRWLVMKQPLQASKDQIQQFDEVMGTHTNRPLQNLNGRMIVH
ncbi:carbonic anhydrase [Vitreoscilla stercoraria]|uniref:Carbonic anhydrase n=1 Tax=Vitreoscilla stercoraria TaxID=61 RepID=A0ABY4EE21_VITST|nr:carbonic anhydrase family protein [Vitreoscilla stercoraria]UOO93469.1 carbonic anhydrase family protein [Vitreoscilla stercoraria]